ncbi:sigma-54-dependent transcriptional regulator [Nannocystaceae bacterium ST9]
MLVVDDDELFCLALGDLLGCAELEIVIAHSLAEARRHDPRGFDLVVLDDRLPDGRGLALLADPTHRPRGRDGQPAQIIVISGAPELDTAIAALRQHALDYFCKPIDLDRLRSLVAGVQAEVTRTRASANEAPLADAGELVGASGPMRTLRAELEQAAASKASVLLTGETGTGKSLAARWLHARSPRASGPFVAINCASLPDSLIESELFGSERGAYTGASERRAGLIESADHGTLFLDEIAELAMIGQAKLLDVLESGQVRRLGATRSREVDVRIVAATHVDLEQACARGRFRRDLLYRLDVLQIGVPPLRERGDDLDDLIARMLTQSGNRARRLATGELERLRAHDWPGNVRELRNLIERACVLQPVEPLQPSRWLSPRPLAPSSHADAVLRVDELALRHMLEVVARSSTRKQAAAALGIGESTLRRKLKQAERMGLWEPSERSA